MENKLKIQLLQENMLEEGVEVLLSAFQKEAFTAAWLDLSRNRQRKIYSRVVRLKFDLYLEAGNPIFSVLEKDKVVGLLVLQAPDIKISKKRLAQLILPRVPTLLALAPYFLRAVPLSGATKPPGNLPEGHYVLEAMAVHPSLQGRGIGRMLLEHARDYCFSDNSSPGIYLFTGDERNRIIYEKFGYKLLEARENKLFTAYHLFLTNNSSQNSKL